VKPFEVAVPGDKSVTHRALMLAALATGSSRLAGCLVSLDTAATASALRALGAAIPELSADGLTIHGAGLGGLRTPRSILDCGNSGTTARLLLGVLAGSGVSAELTGDASLRGRPMRRVTVPLERAGVRFEELGVPGRLPIRVAGGRLRPFEYDAPHASAQVKGALLLAALTGRVSVRLTEPRLSRDHTERMLRAMSVRCASGERADGRAGVILDPADSLAAIDVVIPGDFSSAAFLLALGMLDRRAPGVRVRGVGINPTRTGFLDVARRMGGNIEIDRVRDEGPEPIADLVATPSELRGTHVRGAEIPRLIDEVPAIAVLAAAAEGETRIEGAAELRVKESDRLTALASNLRALGVEAEELADGLVIRGTAAPLRGDIATRGDHRIAMAFGVLGRIEGNDIRIDEPAAADVSFPSFWALLRAAGNP
jgi:3-phosphoshikimate 1-carboxyvinyltransferase